MKNEPNDTEDFNEEHSLLNAIPKQNNFKIPDTYFEQLPAALKSKLSPKKKADTTKLIYISILSLAAALLLIFYTLPVHELPKNTSSNDSPIQETYTVEMIETVFESQLALLEDTSIAHHQIVEETGTSIPAADFTLADLENSFYDDSYY